MLFNSRCFLIGALVLTTRVSSLRSNADSSPHNLSVNLALPTEWRENTSLATGFRDSPSNRSVGAAQIICSGTRYRNNLRPASCLHALSQIPTDTKDLRFSMRSLLRRYDVGLPTRWISCKWSSLIRSKSFVSVGSS